MSVLCCLPRNHPYANCHDPFYSVGTPVFSIHGNHDDPVRWVGWVLVLWCLQFTLERKRERHMAASNFRIEIALG